MTFNTATINGSAIAGPLLDIHAQDLVGSGTLTAGLITFNGICVDSNSDINGMNASGGGAGFSINTSSCDPPMYP